MYHYLFTNDLRISTLADTLRKAGNAFVTDSVPSAIEDKSENNNILTLGFYFNLAKSSNCASACAEGNVREVVLNFIKKFQFPNPRTPESLDDCVADGITIAPMRLILQALYFMNMMFPGSAHLSREEILNFFFYNKDIAKTKTPNISKLVFDINDFRRTNILPSNVETNSENRNWKHEERQIREMTKVLTWSGCVAENDNQELYIHHDGLTLENKADLFDILSYNELWIPEDGVAFNTNKASYQHYMDIKTEGTTPSEIIDWGHIISLSNKDFIFACLKIMEEQGLLNEENLAILTSKELCHSKCGFPIYAILMEVNLSLSYTQQCYISGINRYYPNQFELGEKQYYVCNNWYPEYRSKFVEWLASLIAPGTVIKKHEVKQGENLILYGAPGCGKSRYIKDHFCDDSSYMERVVFHPDYTYTDFVGQILPENNDGHISYPFVPGPFTRILRNAVNDSNHNYYLVIEELNRGNAPAVFGEIFQLLDRIDGESEYGINNSDIAKEVYGDAEHQIKIPKNLFILATMNTADQNVFTLDTAFKRRWSMRSIFNNINTCYFSDELICGTNVSWKSFLTAINTKIVEISEGNIGSEDKRLGAFFVQPRELHDADLFSEKILMYLWNDAFKYDHEKVFKSQYKTLEDLIYGFKSNYFEVFSDDFHFQYVEEGTARASDS